MKLWVESAFAQSYAVSHENRASIVGRTVKPLKEDFAIWIGIIVSSGGSMLISAGCTFFLFLSFSQSAIIALQCLFCGVSVAAWNGIEVVTVELYPASKRYVPGNQKIMKLYQWISPNTWTSASNQIDLVWSLKLFTSTSVELIWHVLTFSIWHCILTTVIRGRGDTISTFCQKWRIKLFLAWGGKKSNKIFLHLSVSQGNSLWRPECSL